MKKIIFIFLLSLMCYWQGSVSYGQGSIPIFRSQNYSSAAAPFSPSDISGLRLWLKADQISGSDGDAVGTWSDQSGNGNDATQATSGNKPVLKTNIINGKAVVRFDGTTDYLSLTTSFYDANSTYFVVMKKTGSVMISLSTDAGTQPYGPFMYSDGNLYVSSQTKYAILSESSTAFIYWTVQINGGDNLTLWKNGASQSVADGPNTNMGTFEVIGRRNSDASYGNGDMAEIIMYNSVLNSTDRGLVETYLAGKYGL